VEAATKIHSLTDLRRERFKGHNLVHEVMNPKVEAWHDVYYHCTVLGLMRDPAGKVVAHVLRRNPFIYRSAPGTTCKNIHALHYPGCTRDHDESDEGCPFYNRTSAAATAVSAATSAGTAVAAATASDIPAAPLTSIVGPFKDVDSPSAKANRQGVFNMYHKFIK
jgi:hypothetical protein